MQQKESSMDYGFVIALYIIGFVVSLFIFHTVLTSAIKGGIVEAIRDRYTPDNPAFVLTPHDKVDIQTLPLRWL